MLKVVLLGVTGAILILIVKEQHKGISAVLLLAASLGIYLLCVEYLSSVLSLVKSVNEMIGVDWLYIKILLKIIGIAYVCQFSSDICKDLGSQSLGKQIESVGKLAVLVVGIPVIQGLFDTMKELLSL